MDDDETYTKLKRDPTKKIERSICERLKSAERNGEIDSKLKSKLSPQNSYIPQFYGLPKLHKPNIPLRPIVSSIGSPTYNLSKELARILSPLRGKTTSYIKNSSHFVEMIKDRTISESDLMVSFDIKSLFTRVPIKECLEIVEEKLNSDDTLGERTTLTPSTITNLLSLCMSSTYFGFEESIFEQKAGVPMGSPVSPILADLYMEYFEQKAITMHQEKPDLWLRYVDDTFVIWKHGREKFLSHLNSYNDYIKFTMEIEDGGSLPFLDVRVIRKGQHLVTSVYRKATHTDRYLNYNSNHHPSIKTGIVKCLAHRARSVCSEENIDKEMHHLQSVFEKNDYPTPLVNKYLTSHPRTNRDDDNIDTEEKKKILVLPYVKGLSERIGRVCHNLDVNLVSTSTRTLRSQLMHVKNRIAEDQVCGVVYSVDCQCGHTYVGETGRTLNTRLKEHMRAVQRHDLNNGISVHANSAEHNIRWKSAQVIHREQHWMKRKLLESLYIRDNQNSTMNLDNGLRSNPPWVTLDTHISNS